MKLEKKTLSAMALVVATAGLVGAAALPAEQTAKPAPRAQGADCGIRGRRQYLPDHLSGRIEGLADALTEMWDELVDPNRPPPCPTCGMG